MPGELGHEVQFDQLVYANSILYEVAHFCCGGLESEPLRSVIGAACLCDKNTILHPSKTNLDIKVWLAALVGST